jgi:hypothetical protein
MRQTGAIKWKFSTAASPFAPAFPYFEPKNQKIPDR